MTSLDDALDSYLDTLDLYSLATARLNQNLKSGFFDLAKAKQVLGHARVDQASLSQTTPSIAVSIEEDSSFLIVPVSTAPPPPSPALPASSSLRNRNNNTFPPSSPTDSTPPAAPTPLDRISALPPAALRSAQTAFESALKSAVEVVSIVQELARLEREVTVAREVEKDRIVGGGGGKSATEEGESAPMKCDDLD